MTEAVSGLTDIRLKPLVRMRTHNHIADLDAQIINSDVNVNALLPMIEDAINMEERNREARETLGHEVDAVKSEILITEYKILLSLLRRHRDAGINNDPA